MTIEVQIPKEILNNRNGNLMYKYMVYRAAAARKEKTHLDYENLLIAHSQGPVNRKLKVSLKDLENGKSLFICISGSSH